MTAPTTATTIDLTAALAQAEVGATVTWTIKDTNTTNVKIKDDTAEGKDTVTNTLEAGSLGSNRITLNIPANIDVSGGDKSVRVEVVYTGKPTSETPKARESVPSVVATKTLTITRSPWCLGYRQGSLCIPSYPWLWAAGLYCFCTGMWG